MARTWACFGVYRLHQSPEAVLQAVPVEIIDSIVAVVASEDVDAVSINDSRVSVTWGGGLRVCDWKDFCPETVVEVELEKVVPSICSVVAAKDVEVIFNADRSMQRTRTGRVSFVNLMAFNHMPRPWLFNPVLGGAVFVAVDHKDILVLIRTHNSPVGRTLHLLHRYRRGR